MEPKQQPSVHQVLAQSYLVYFLLCSIGLFVDLIIPFTISMPYSLPLAIIFFALGPALIFWAQYTSWRFEKIKQQTGRPDFSRGPYRFLRNPTQFGLVLLVAGYAFASRAAMLFVATGVAYLISNIFFRKHETILESKYGEDYQSYKSSVPKIM